MYTQFAIQLGETQSQNNYMSSDLQQQCRQFMYNVTFKLVLTTIVAVEMKKYYLLLVCVCTLDYPECNTHASYRQL